MTDQFRKEWRTIDPLWPRSSARHYDSPTDARADAKRFPDRVVQQRLVSDWEDDQ